jgi:hypothetical protein
VPDLRDRCRKRLDGLKAARRPYEAEAKEIASLAMPSRSRFLASGKDKVRQPNRRLNSSHGIKSFRTLQGGMTSGLSSQSRPWFNLQTFDEGLSEDAEVKSYLAEVERRMYAFLAQTNFYGAVKTGYLELGGFGTEACIMAEHPTEGAVCHQLTFGEYWLALGSALTPEALYRECSMSVLQAMQRFKPANVSRRINNMYDRSDYDEIVCFYQAIEKNDELETNRLDWRGKPWRSVYWDDSDEQAGRLTDQRGFDEQPFWAPRWDTTGADIWGQGPGLDTLPDLRELQMQVKRKGEATDMSIWPEIVSSSKVKLRRQPKSVVSSAEVDMGKLISVPYQVPYQTIGMVREDIADIKQAIDELTYADLFMAITNMQGIQPRNIEEIAARNEEKLTQLGPVIERVNNEKLEVAIDRVFGIMQRSRLLPPAPDKLAESPDLKIEFVSILTQMQRMVGLGQIERAMGFVGNMMGAFPEVRHKIDAMEIVDEYWSRAGAPPKGIRPTVDAQEDAAAEQQQQQAAQMAEMAGKAAPAGKVAVEAASLMAETSAGAMPMAGAMPL